MKNLIKEIDIIEGESEVINFQFCSNFAWQRCILLAAVTTVPLTVVGYLFVSQEVTHPQ